MTPPSGLGHDGGTEEEEDYMSMVFEEPKKPDKETSIQRRARKQREGEIKGRVKSKQEKDEEETAQREAALSTALDSSNKGFRMMAKLGYEPGKALGKSGDARVDPIHLSMKEDRGGVGLDSEKKRKIREDLAHEAKRVKAGEVDYRDRLRLEREEKRMESQLIGAQKVLEKFDSESEDPSAAIDDPPTAKPNRSKPLKSVHFLWRGIVRHRLEKERDRRMRHDLQQSLTRNPTYDDPEQDEDDKLAMGGDQELIDDLDEEDPELDEFNAWPVNERLEKVVMWLREKHHYCFWCKHQYEDSKLDGCPGVTEEDHD